MPGETLRIGIVAPGSAIDREIADRVRTVAEAWAGERQVQLDFHPQCFLSSGHFAGDDAARAAAFLTVANDPSYDVLWSARGGYGACRITEAVLAGLTPAARGKRYIGYSDTGTLLAGLYKQGFANLAHGPMPVDIIRAGGEAAVERSLAYLCDRSPGALEPSLVPGQKTVAFNMATFSHLLGTPFQPDLADHVLMLEEISEYMYAIDRLLFHITSDPGIRQVAGIRLGRCNQIPENDRDFGQTEEEVVRHWCAKSGIPYLGRADIGHDADNKVVPFGGLPAIA